MSLEFKGSPTPSIGVEIELQVLDPKTLDLTAPSDLLIRKSSDEGLERVKSEIHQSMIEIDTEVSSDVKECREFLRSRSKRLSALAISNMLTKYLPHLLALSANSPFWQGLDTGMNSSRINIMESFPFGGIPKAFKEWKEFEYYYETLNRVGAISSFHITPSSRYQELF